MASMERNQKGKGDNMEQDTSKILGFHTGASVKINKHFFANRGLKYVDFGSGTVVEKLPPSKKNQLWMVKVQFPYNRNFYQEPFSKMLSDSLVNNYKILTIIEIFPAYLDKVKK